MEKMPRSDRTYPPIDLNTNLVLHIKQADAFLAENLIPARDQNNGAFLRQHLSDYFRMVPL